MANYLKKKRIRRRKIDKGNYLQLSNCYCLLTPTPHPPTCIHMLLLRRERKQKKKGAQPLSFPVCTLIYWQWGHRFRQGKRHPSTRSHVIEKNDAFFHLHSYPSSISLFHISPPHPSLFQMKHWKREQQSETNVTSSSSSCSFFLSICHPILPAIGTARECQMLFGVKTITTTPFRSPTVGPFRSYLCVCLCIGHWRHDRQRSNGRRTCPRDKRREPHTDNII
jgi:hypothetical protein